MQDKDKVEALIEEGRRFLESEDYDKAIAVGKKIEQECHSYAFELMALAYAAKGDLQKAIATLERGVKLAPSAWLLWQLLGNYYSDASRWDDAQQAYARALECPNADQSSINYNITMAFLRAGKTADALNNINRVISPELQLKAASLQIDIYAANGDNVEAIRYAKQVLAEAITDDEEDIDEEELPDIADIYGAYARAVWKQGDTNQALELAWQAISLWKHQERAMWLIREIENKRSNSARNYRLMIEGAFPDAFEDEEEPLGFFVTYEIVADNPEEAFSLAARFEPDYLRESLHVCECDVSDEKVDEPKGVYFVSGYCCFPIEESE